MTPAELNTVLKRLEPGKILANKEQSNYWSGTRKMMHMMRWSRLDMNNTTHDYTRHIVLAGSTHYNAMVCKMDYWVTTPERGLVLKPHGD